MLCIGCGTFNTEDSIYCKKCGSPIEPEEETRVAPKKEMIANEPDEEQRIFSITPTLKFVYAGYFLAVVSAFVVVAMFSVFLLQFVSAWLGVLIGMSLLLVPAFYHIRQKLVRYTLTDTKVEIDEGLISRTTLNVPLRRVQDVTVKATIPQRLLGLGDIVVDNAGTDGGRTILKNVDSPRKYADQLLRQLRRLER
jgi:putative membrane protein